MNIIEMHYDFKQKINKADTQQYMNLRPAEIDWYLNEAQLVFVKTVAFPKSNPFAFEMTQRTIDDIRSIVKDSGVLIPDSDNIVDLPDDYLFFSSGKASIDKMGCHNIARILIKAHNEQHVESSFYNSSFEWGEVNADFHDNRMRLYTDGTFSIASVILEYIKRPVAVFFGGYDSLDGNYTSANSSVNCELPEHVHNDVVDYAVLMATSAIQIPDYSQKVNTMTLKQS